MDDRIRQLLRLPEGTDKLPKKRKPTRFARPGYSREKQRDRLGEKFDSIEDLLADPDSSLLLAGDPLRVAPDRVLVLEVRNSIDDFIGIASSIEGLELLADEAVRIDSPDDFDDEQEISPQEVGDVEADLELFDDLTSMDVEGDEDSSTPMESGRMYLSLPHQGALDDIRYLWNLWTNEQELPPGKKRVEQLFAQLHDIRVWGPKDRLSDLAVSYWSKVIRDESPESLLIEAELWFREDSADATKAEEQLREAVGKVGGTVMDDAKIDAIRYHALLIEVPGRSMGAMLERDEESPIVVCNDVMFFRPQTSVHAPAAEDIESGDGGAVAPRQLRAVDQNLSPLVAIIDGYPAQNNPYLQNRLEVNAVDLREFLRYVDLDEQLFSEFAMARLQASVPGGPRLADHLSIGLLAHIYPRDAVEAALAASGCGSARRRSLPAEAAVYFVIALGLYRPYSTREVLRCLSAGLQRMGDDPIRVPDKAAISRARQRLGTAPFEELRRRRVRPLTTPGEPGAGFRGMHLMALDGSTLDMPDEVGNRESFGAPGGPRGTRAAFPHARLTVLLEVGSRAVLAWEHGPYRESEMVQAERLVRRFEPGMLVLADRYYGVFPLWRKALRTGADLLWRVRGNMRLPVEQVYADGSYRSRLRASGQDRRRCRGAVEVRVIEYQLPGSDTVYRLITTVPPDRALAAELAHLYHERWEVETAYDEIKTHMLTPGPGGSTALRSKTPRLVRQEIDGILLAHYAVRCLLHATARANGGDPDGLSFTHAVHVIRRDLQHGPDADSAAGAGIPSQVIREINDERAERSRGQSKPRGVRRHRNRYPIRRPGCPTRKVPDRWPKVVKFA